MGKRSYQSDQELSCSYNKRHKQIYSTDNTNANKDIKNITRAKIEERKRKIEERKQNQIIEEVTK